MITYHCPHCRERLQVSDERAGTAYACTLCGQSTLVPGERPAVQAPAPATPSKTEVMARQLMPTLFPTGGDAAQHAQRLEALQQIELSRPLSKAEWLEVAEHYTALGERELAAQAVRRADSTAANDQFSGQPQVTIINQNTTTATAAASNATDSCGGCVGLAAVAGCFYFASGGCLLPLLAAIVAIAAVLL